MPDTVSRVPKQIGKKNGRYHFFKKSLEKPGVFLVFSAGMGLALPGDSPTPNRPRGKWSTISPVPGQQRKH